jgi:hypothetical protein
MVATLEVSRAIVPRSPRREDPLARKLRFRKGRLHDMHTSGAGTFANRNDPYSRQVHTLTVRDNAMRIREPDRAWRGWTTPSNRTHGDLVTFRLLRGFFLRGKG